VGIFPALFSLPFFISKTPGAESGVGGVWLFSLVKSLYIIRKKTQVFF